ncbi:MAG: beta-ketoacyl-[acyl-carrier-protein] synthase family protein [Planctomycetota bacterium]
MQRRVVATGLNVITPLGLDLESSWDGLVAGRSGIGKISLFDASTYQTRIAGELPADFDEYARRHCSRRLTRQMARAVKMGYVCTKEAVEKSQINFDDYDRLRCAVIFGAADTGHSSIYDDQYWIVKTMPHGVSSWISQEYKLEGPNLIVSAACASSAYAVAYGYDLIVANKADVVIAGGASSIVNPEHVSGFNELLALSVANDIPQRASRPFSKGRDGFVIGEGAGALVLESEESARARGATIYAEVAGYAMTSEAHNIMAPRPEGVAMAKTMRKALEETGIARDRIDYINAHGTSTAQNDKCETKAIKEVFGDLAYGIPVSSAKSMIGHTAGACGAIEAAITMMSICNGILTPTINHTPDPELDLDYVPNKAREKDVKVALSNSFGFGGCNATLVLRKYE